MFRRICILAVSLVLLAGCSPDEKGIRRDDPTFMHLLSLRMRDAGIPFRATADGVLWYAPQYSDQVKQLTAALDKPYVEETFRSPEYKQLVLAELAARGRKYEFVPNSAEQSIRWWPEAPGELQQVQERVSEAWAKTHSSTDFPCQKVATPSNSRCSGSPSATADQTR